MNKNFFSKNEELKKDLTNTFSPKVKSSKIDIGSKWAIIIWSFFVIIILFLLVGFMIYKSTNVFHNFGFFNFIFSGNWNPKKNGDSSASYGIAKIIVSTIVILIISLLIAIPLNIFASVFISKYLKPKTKSLVISFIQLMAGIPSIIFGLFAIDQIGHIFVLMGASSPKNMMTASVTLAFMSLPTMITLSVNAIDSVPDGYMYASLGLGVTKEKTVFKVILKSAKAKIITAIIVSAARIIGETMAVIMIAGGSNAGIDTSDGIKEFFFSSVSTLAGTIGLEMLENSGTTHESALYAIGLVLFLIVIIINLIILFFSREKSRVRVRKNRKGLNEINENSPKIKKYNKYQLKRLITDYTKKRSLQEFESFTLKTFMIASLTIVISFIFWILVTILLKGFDGFNWSSFMVISGNKSGILSSLIITILLIILTLTIAIPFSLVAAIYLAEYASEKRFFTKFIRFSISVLSSTPSIVFGVFGLTFFITFLNIPMSIFSASLTMTIVLMPSMIIMFEDAIRFVPDSYRETAIGMGLGKSATIFKIVLPSAFKNMVTGIILSIARIIGESAPVYLTLGTAIRMPTTGFFSSGATLTSQIYVLINEGSSTQSTNDAYMTALVTIVIIVFLNLFSHKISTKLNPMYKKISFKEKWNIFLLKFRRENFIKFKKSLIHFFVKSWTNFKNLFDFKRIKRRLKYSKDNREEIKAIKKEVNKNGAN